MENTESEVEDLSIYLSLQQEHLHVGSKIERILERWGAKCSVYE